MCELIVDNISRLNRHHLCLVFCLAGSVLLSGQARADPSMPQTPVRSIYESEKPGGRPMPSDEAGLRRLFEPTLAAAWAGNQAKYNDSTKEIGDDVIDFDPFIAGQDAHLTGLRIGQPRPAKRHTEVSADFRNFGKRVHLVYDVIETSDGWRVFDLHLSGGGTLRRLLHLK